MRRLVPVALAIAGCTAPGMHRLTVGGSPAADPLPADCPAGCDREQRVRSQTWREVDGLEGERVRLVFAADTGEREHALRKDSALAEAPLRVAAAARAVCAGSCDGSVFVGDNLYPAGIGTGGRGARDRADLDAFLEAWDFTDGAWFALGNHDWGTYPTALHLACGLLPCEAVGAPQRDRAQRELDFIRGAEAAHGDAHFWEAELGPVHAVALDTMYLTRRCRGEPVRCAGDRQGDQPLSEAIATMVERAPAERTVVFGHHPDYSGGEHGSAGDYLDFPPFSLGRGEAVRAVLDAQVRPHAALYVAGHDHGTQVHLEPGLLSLVVGAGGDLSPPGARTAPGEARAVPVDFEAWCRLGFAVLDAGPEGLAVQVYTLVAPEEVAAHCEAEARDRRPVHMRAQAERAEATLGAPVPGAAHDLRCVRYAQAEAGWRREPACQELGE